MKNQTLLDAQKHEAEKARARFETITLRDAITNVQFTDKELAFHATKGWDTLAVLNAYMDLVMEDLHQVETLTSKLNEGLNHCEGGNGRETSDAGKFVREVRWQLFGVSRHLRGTATNLLKAVRLCLNWESNAVMSQAIALSSQAFMVAHVTSDNSRD
jgi:hypothetical protein